MDVEVAQAPSSTAPAAPVATPPTQVAIDRATPRSGAKPSAPPTAKAPPPIFLRKGANFVKIFADCTRLHINYSKAVRVADDGIKIICPNVETFRSLNKYLVDNKVQFQEFRNESWSDLMEEITPSHKAFWKITKALKTEGYTPIPPLKRPDGSIAYDDAEVAECIADSIETQCSHASPPHDTAHISSIEEEVLQKTSLEPKDNLTLVSLSEVQLLVRSLKTRKAPGLDGVRKPRDLPASYRPISLLSGLAKLFERVLKTRLNDHLLGKGLIIDEQFGFRPAHSCPQQVLRVVEYISEGFKNKQKTVAVFFDVAKAFDSKSAESEAWAREEKPPEVRSYAAIAEIAVTDRVWHAGLVHKLYSLQVPDRLVIIIQNYLANKYCTFRHERTHLTRRLIRSGVPQGSALSPLLYSAYTNDISRPTSGVQLALLQMTPRFITKVKIEPPFLPSAASRGPLMS
ncbi:Probable RNA-directed DNA polymerase from transposon BS [Eumeta japonica]|uniref:Probable RNA-directed DNA polymerase from transposon BS n=1 Tax=Eumeta variegata TaxID=151549 RepID=A0A4C1XWX1_EUMVA|nr:Probable RNA-directed DNA polymerase from transposon BS [Eumeta japonica]